MPSVARAALRIPIVPVLATLYVVLNVAAIALWPRLLGDAPHGATDFTNLSALTFGHPYAVPSFRWTPPAAWLWIILVAPLGAGLWSLLHVGALALLRNWWAIVLVGGSFPFWCDVLNGNVLTFVVVVGWWAVRANRFAASAFIVLTVLMPRPLMLPLAGWILWKQPRNWYVAGAVAAAVLLTSIATNELAPFVNRLTSTGSEELVSPWNVAPSAVIGVWWIPIGALLAVVLVRLRKFGLAGICLSPYLLGYYLLFAAIDLPERPSRLLGRTSPNSAAPSPQALKQSAVE